MYIIVTIIFIITIHYSIIIIRFGPPKFEVDAGRADYAATVGPQIMLKYQEYFNVM